jgi:hypothetical protein
LCPGSSVIASSPEILAFEPLLQCTFVSPMKLPARVKARVYHMWGFTLCRAHRHTHFPFSGISWANTVVLMCLTNQHDMHNERVGRGVIQNMSTHAHVAQRVVRVVRSIPSFPARSFHICILLLKFEMLLESVTLPEIHCEKVWRPL